jgi:cytochrome c oxidase subunit IV
VKVFGRIGLVFGVFFVIMGALYGITNKEYEGFPLLLMTAGGFTILAVWALRRFARAERETGDEGEEVGEPHVGPTIWPLVLALSAIAFVLGVLGAKWLFVLGGVLFVVAAAGWFVDVRRQWQHSSADAHAMEAPKGPETA